MRFHINPILKKELKIGSRTIKLPLAISVYSLVLAVIAYAILAIESSDIYSYRQSYTPISYNSITYGFVILAYTQIAIICFIIPLLTASSIAGEREKQTLDIMLTAPVSSFSIVMGKLFTALITVFMFIISSIPAMSVCFLYGGIEWTQLIVFILSSLVIGFFVGSIGVWCSSVFKKTVLSVIMTMIFEGSFFLIPLFTFMGIVSRRMYSDAVMAGKAMGLGCTPLLLFFDPAVAYVQTIQKTTSSFDVTELFDIGDANIAPIVEILLPYFQYVSLAITILIAFGFVWLAARRIDAPRAKSKKRSVNYGQSNQEIHN